MTFNEVTFKMFKANLKRYLICFLCSSFAIMVFFIYATLYTNKDFMNAAKVDGSISSMIVAPNYGVIIFSIFFIIYTHSSLEKYRKKEFGLFMTLGMTNIDIVKIIIYENSLIAAASLIAGLLSGVIFSRLFFFLVLRIINVSGISYYLSPKSFMYTAGFFTLIYIAVILWSALAASRYEIVTLLKEFRMKDKNLMNKPVFLILGIVFMVLSIFDQLKNYTNDSPTAFLRSLALCFAGIYLLITNIALITSKFIKRSSKRYSRNIIFIADLKYTIGQSKKIMLVITLLISITIFFNSLITLLTSDARRTAIGNNPYHIAYTQLYDKNEISQETLNSIIKNGETPLTSYKSIRFLKERYLTILSDKELNSVFATDFHVKPNHFLTLFQFIKNDGYTHDDNEIKNLYIEVNGKTYISQGKVIKVIFNDVPVVAEGHYVIINDNDYNALRPKFKQSTIGKLNLMNFKDWTKTGGIYDKLKGELEKYNKLKTQAYYVTYDNDNIMFSPSSRIGDYLKTMHSGSFALFLYSFVGALFFIASCVLLHFKLLTEFEREKIKFTKLFKIGITDKEVKEMISKQLRLIFFLPFILATFIAAFYNYSMGWQIGAEGTGVVNSFLIGLIYMVLQMIYYLIYRNVYVNKMLSI